MILVGSATEVKLLFLKNDDINSSMTNSFFCCNVKNSKTLLWEISDFGIGKFNHLEDVISNRMSIYTYFASLLSMRNNTGQYMLDSVLIVTAPTGSTVNVSCVSNRGIYKTISNKGNPTNTEYNKPIGNTSSVKMQPVFLTNSTIVSDGNDINTRAFLCGTINSSDLSWEANTSNAITHLAFSTKSDIGISYSRLTDERNTVRLQSVSLGRHLEKFYSILYVTDDTFEEVRCLAGGSTVEYSVHKDSETITSAEVFPGSGSPITSQLEAGSPKMTTTLWILAFLDGYFMNVY